MPIAQDPHIAYASSLATEQERLARLRRWLHIVVWTRIASLVLFVGLAAQSCSRHERSWFGIGTSALAFIALSVVIAWLERRVTGHEARVTYFQAGESRLHGRKPEAGEDGKRFCDASHPYAADIDIFGPASLFSLLCAARTGSGQNTLARWLKQPAAIDDIAPRQRAVGELRTILPLRLDLWLAGGVVSKQVREDALEAWLTAPAVKTGLSTRITTGILGSTGLAALYALVDTRFIAVAGVIILLQRLFALKHRALVQKVQANIFQRAYELRVVARLAELLRGQEFSDPHLAALVASISDEGQPASRHIFHLVRLVDWLESRRNQLFGLIAGALLLLEQLSFAIENWRWRHGNAALRWLAAIGEMEALSSIATFSFEHPEYPFPELLPSGESPQLRATALGHPLIPAQVRVCNDVALDSARRFLVVTGSNMSGKSTLLRTVGVNVALAQAGAPVCATHMSLTQLQIGASLRAQDSLEHGESRFFAEIKRLQAILAMSAGEPPVLFLLDEILNGTNSIDRREGAEAVVRRLLERNAIGFITTHDLALSDLANAPELRGGNIHFQDSLEGDRMIFEYRIRAGVVTRRNALDLMRLVGIEVPARKAEIPGPG